MEYFTVTVESFLRHVSAKPCFKSSLNFSGENDLSPAALIVGMKMRRRIKTKIAQAFLVFNKYGSVLSVFWVVAYTKGFTVFIKP